MAELLNSEALHAGLAGLDGWQGSTSGISKTFHFDDPAAAEAFLVRVSEIADDMNHHPEIDRGGQQEVTLTLVTHSAGGVTQLDLDLAERIDADA